MRTIGLKRRHVGYLAVAVTATLLAVTVQLARSPVATASPIVRASSELTEKSGTSCTASWQPYFYLPDDLESQLRAASVGGWVADGRVFRGGLAELSERSAGSVFSEPASEESFVTGEYRGEYVMFSVVRAPTTTEAWVVTSVWTPIPCEE